MPFHRIACGVVALALVGASLPVAAQVTIPEEYGKAIQAASETTALGTDLFGDATNLYTGATTFNATDIMLPGNSALSVSLGRRFTVARRDPDVTVGDGMFGNWDLDIPHLHGVFAASTGWQVENFSPAGGHGDPTARCSAKGLREAKRAAGTFGGQWTGSQYWQGYHLYSPGAGNRTLLVMDAGAPRPSDGLAYPWMTRDLWTLSCLPGTANGVAGEGFLARSPDGLTYRFDWVVARPASTIVRELGSATPYLPEGNSTSLMRSEVWILPTRVSDQFGNAVTYTWDAAKPWRLHAISANDGRRISLQYNAGGRIASATDGTHTWLYEYSGNQLLYVVQPDATRWTYALGGLDALRTRPETNQAILAFCQRAASAATQPIHTGTITHPSGAIGTFRFQSRVHGRSYVYRICVKPDTARTADYAHHPFLFDAIGLVDKEIRGPGIPDALRWTVQFGPTNQSWEQDCAAAQCVASKTVDVQGPGAFRRYTFSNRAGHAEGALLKLEEGHSPAAIMRTESFEYVMDPVGQPYAALAGRSPFDRGDGAAEKPTPLRKRVIQQQGEVFTREVLAFDAFMQPTRVNQRMGVDAAPPPPPAPPPPSAPIDAAAFAGQSVATSMVTGQLYSVTVQFTNTGNTTWTSAEAYRLGAQNPHDNTNWGITNRVWLPGDVAPGQVATFTWDVTGPAVTQHFQWRMVRDGVAWFGETSPNVTVAAISPYASAFEGHTPPPTQMIPAEWATVVVTVKNTGSVAWHPGAVYFGRANGAQSTPAHLALSHAVSPGANATFSYTFVAPQGSVSPMPQYYFGGRMFLASGAAFGPELAQVRIWVENPNGHCNPAKQVCQQPYSLGTATGEESP